MHNLLHFLTLRVDSHAQWEIQQFGKIMAGMLKRVAPLAYEAWVDYEVCGARLSRMELEILRRLVGVEPDGDLFVQSDVFPRTQTAQAGLSEREADEFFALFSSDARAVPDFELDLSRAKTAEYFEAQASAAVPGGK
jgi:hypothetical protein